MKSQSFLTGLNLKPVAISHGGELRRGQRKITRPIDPKQALHVVLRSSKAKGELSLLHSRNAKRVQDITLKAAKRLGIRIYRYSNVGNHLHLLVKVPSRAAWQRFSKEIAGLIARAVTGAKKGTEGKFWDHLTFTRIVRFGKDFEGLAKYVVKNLFEAAGVSMQGRYVRFISKDGLVTGPPQIGR